MKRQARIILADDHKIFVDGLKSLLTNEESFSVVGEAYNGVQLIKLTETIQPDIVITDVDMPEMDGLEAMRIIRTANPGIKFVILSMHFEFQFMKYAFENGASAYIPKERSSDELINVIYDVLNNSYENEFHFEALSSPYEKDSLVGAKNKVLFTETERKVLIELALGSKDKKIADTLNVSIHTVDKYKRILKEKTGLKSCLSLAIYAIKNGYVNINEL